MDLARHSRELRQNGFLVSGDFFEPGFMDVD